MRDYQTFKTLFLSRTQVLRHSDLLTKPRTSLMDRGVVNLRHFKRISELILELKE